jgi:hypothetical protein
VCVCVCVCVCLGVGMGVRVASTLPTAPLGARFWNIRHGESLRRNLSASRRGRQMESSRNERAGQPYQSSRWANSLAKIYTEMLPFLPELGYKSRSNNEGRKFRVRFPDAEVFSRLKNV